MKRSLTLVLVAFVLSLALIANGLAETKKVDIPVKGMKCQECVEKITKALKDVKGVVEVDVCLKSKAAKVTFDPAQTNEAALESVIASVGYDAGSTKAANPHKCDEKKDCAKKAGDCGKAKKSSDCGAKAKASAGCCEKK